VKISNEKTNVKIQESFKQCEKDFRLSDYKNKTTLAKIFFLPPFFAEESPSRVCSDMT